jgi:hypothetical protein
LRKWLVILLIFLLLGCSNEKKQPVEKSNNGGKMEEATPRQIMDRAVNAAGSLESFSMKMKISQQINPDSQSDKIDLQSSINTDLITNPLAFHQKMNMKMQGSGQAYNTETYFTKNGMFLFDATAKTWMKVPDEMVAQFTELANQHTNPAEELRRIKNVTDEFALESEPGEYLLKVKASGKKFADFARGYIQQSIPPELASDQKIWDGMNVKGIQYDISIDKKTFYPESINIEMDLEINTEKEKIRINQALNGDYSNFNSVEKISVPKEVADNAETLTN